MKECIQARNLLPVQYVVVVSDSKISYKNICVYTPKNALINVVMRVVKKRSVHQAVESITNKAILALSNLNVFIVLDILRIG